MWQDINKHVEDAAIGYCGHQTATTRIWNVIKSYLNRQAIANALDPIGFELATEEFLWPERDLDDGRWIRLSLITARRIVLAYENADIVLELMENYYD